VPCAWCPQHGCGHSVVFLPGDDSDSATGVKVLLVFCLTLTLNERIDPRRAGKLDPPRILLPKDKSTSRKQPHKLYRIASPCILITTQRAGRQADARLFVSSVALLEGNESAWGKIFHSWSRARAASSEGAPFRRPGPFGSLTAYAQRLGFLYGSCFCAF